MSWSGHRTLKEVARYTQSADQRALARSAETKLATKLSKPTSLFDKSRKKPTKIRAKNARGGRGRTLDRISLTTTCAEVRELSARLSGKDNYRRIPHLWK
jgi:hypothetical protein